MPQLKWYFEDFAVGATIEVGSRQVSEQEIIDFAKQFDPQPFHIDRQAAAESIYGGIIASGWHTCSMMMKLMVDNLLHDAASLGSPGLDEIRWSKPVRGGDTLSVSCTVLGSQPSISKPDRGVVRTQWHTNKQQSKQDATVTGMALFLKRPS